MFYIFYIFYILYIKFKIGLRLEYFIKIYVLLFFILFSPANLNLILIFIFMDTPGSMGKKNWNPNVFFLI